ncbi:hypothetical protein [Runella limosa]|uniref:hypothetical protein n=1 Tax=Runella limosa TaxID=370978 RepID=UPI00048BC5A6|nr:hypothetical protein [Runella limosa]
MDKSTLVSQINNLVTEFKKEGKEVTRFAIISAYPEYESSPFILAIACPWMAGYTSCFAKTEEVVKKMYTILAPEAIGKIHAVNVFDSAFEVDQFWKEEGCDYFSASCGAIINPLQEEILI